MESLSNDDHRSSDDYGLSMDEIAALAHEVSGHLENKVLTSLRAGELDTDLLVRPWLVYQLQEILRYITPAPRVVTPASLQDSHLEQLLRETQLALTEVEKRVRSQELRDVDFPLHLVVCSLEELNQFFYNGDLEDITTAVEVACEAGLDPDIVTRQARERAEVQLARSRTSVEALEAAAHGYALRAEPLNFPLN